MPTFRGNAVSLYYEQTGSRADPPMVLIHGWSCQLVQWPRTLIDGLAERGLRVITFDNRDAGRSEKLEHATTPSIAEVRAEPSRYDPPYRIADMARDVTALLDHLGQAGAHIVGFSMGGMIGQRLAAEHPERVFSFASIASTTGNPSLPRASADAVDAFLADPPSENRDETIAFLRRGWDVIGGPHYRSSSCGIAKLVAQAVDRGFSPQGNARQLLAILSDGNRADVLSRVSAPTLVLHGAEDPLVPPAAAEDTARCIRGATLVVLPKLGHDLSDPVIPELVDRIAHHALATRRR